MPKQKPEQLTEFGKRLAALRKQAGYTQTELAQELGVTADELLGIKPLKKSRQPDSRLLRRMQQIDTVIENEHLKRQTAEGNTAHANG